MPRLEILEKKKLYKFLGPYRGILDSIFDNFDSG